MFNDTTTQVVEKNYWYNPENEESFLKMRDCGKNAVNDYTWRYSPETIQTFLEDGDIWVSNHVEGWWENTKNWKQEDYDRMREEFNKGFREGLYELERTKEREYDYDYDLWDSKWGYDPDDEWSDPSYSNSYKPWIYGKIIV